MTGFIFVRHGQSQANADGVIATADSPLTALGREQAHQTARKLKALEITTIACSPLLRARQTAAVIAQELGIDAVQIKIMDELQERDLGDLKGKPKAHESAYFYTVDNEFNVETRAQTLQRMTLCMAKLRQLGGHGKVLVVGHATSGFYLLQAVKGKTTVAQLDPPEEVQNGAQVSFSLPPPEKVVFEGKIGEIVHIPQADGRVFEQYRRAPGTRLVIVSPDKKVLVTKEHRAETGRLDLRLPGGKVRDSLPEYHALLASGQDMVEAASAAAAKEALEEVGLVVRNLRLIVVANAGATVAWDLLYFQTEAYESSPDGQALEPGEDIAITWMSPAEIRQAIAKDQMQEWRSAGVLLGKVLPALEARA